MADNTNFDLVEKLGSMLEKQTEALNSLLLTKTPAGTMTANSIYGSGGFMSIPGIDRKVYTAHMRPMPGLASEIPLLPSVDEDPRFASITGFTAAAGTSNTSACGDAPSGFVKGCNLTARFGRIRVDTNTIEFDKVMLRVNRGVMTDLQMAGQILNDNNLSPSNTKPGDVLSTITKSEMVIAGVHSERETARQVWQGVWGTSSIFGPEFPGLDVQIATGIKDADNSVLCPALDSDVKNYGFKKMSADIVEYLSMLEFYVTHNARQMGLLPVEWVFVMRPEMWQELSEIWPCAYNTGKCSQILVPAANYAAATAIDGRENIAQRDSMRASETIYRVILDDGIYEHTSATNSQQLNPGEYASSIYFVPLRVMGFPVLYREYVDYKQGAADVGFLNNMQTFFWSDSGVFSWALEQIKWCYKLSLKTEQRIILRTPQLAGRLDDVMVAPLQHIRSSNPSSAHFFDGGTSIRNGLAAVRQIWG
jgi:hypothetical protein